MSRSHEARPPFQDFPGQGPESRTDLKHPIPRPRLEEIHNFTLHVRVHEQMLARDPADREVVFFEKIDLGRHEKRTGRI